ncbi:hypothetical protein J6590_003479 [Homalodisca vitripennis]|nr:hypothetical protein J6590_003479 [Homalodisca vitripennis]
MTANEHVQEELAASWTRAKFNNNNGLSRVVSGFRGRVHLLLVHIPQGFCS